MRDFVDLFAGPGGWDVAASGLGLHGVGIESDPVVCQTRRAAGLPTVEGDVRDYGPARFIAAGLLASPPCQTFSTAGKGSGRKALDQVVQLAQYVTATGLAPSRRTIEDDRTTLVLEPLRWIVRAHRAGTPYAWVALEQVPSVLPVWNAYAGHLRTLGYGVSAAVLTAEQYGVPQTRRRAVLVARLDGPAHLPEPTHSRYYARDPDQIDHGLRPWVSMADALGWGLTDRPASTVRGASIAYPRGFEDRINNQSGTLFDIDEQISSPATAVAGREIVAFRGQNANRFNGSTKSRNDGLRVTPEEAARLQTFPDDYPWQGGIRQKYRQVGNAMPPQLATAVLKAVTREPDPELPLNLRADPRTEFPAKFRVESL